MLFPFLRERLFQLVMLLYHLFHHKIIGFHFVDMCSQLFFLEIVGSECSLLKTVGALFCLVSGFLDALVQAL